MRRFPLLRLALRAALDWLAPVPGQCLLCGRPDPEAGQAPVCAACRQAAAPGWPRCPCCGRLQPREEGAGRPCRRCRVHPPPYQGVVQAGPYAGVLRWAVLRFKHAGESYLARPLADLVLPGCLGIPAAEGLVPVPARREARREYHPAELLARSLADPLELPVWTRVLRRRPGLPSQAGRSREERVANAARAFAPGDPRPVRGRRVWLVDDVLTTGATLEACTRLLLTLGAREVWCVVVAEAVRPKRARAPVR